MNLINLTTVGIKSINYYWDRRDKFNLTEEELRAVGVMGNYAQLDASLIQPLQKANELFREHGYEIIVKDGYRPPELYQLVKAKRYEIDGKENTDKTFNPIGMPHSTGHTVDISLLNLNDGTEVDMWDKKDWPDGIFVGFYKNKTDKKSKQYQKLQDLLHEIILPLGFRLGGKKEFWHFEYEGKN